MSIQFVHSNQGHVPVFRPTVIVSSKINVCVPELKSILDRRVFITATLLKITVDGRSNDRCHGMMKLNKKIKKLGIILGVFCSIGLFFGSMAMADPGTKETDRSPVKVPDIHVKEGDSCKKKGEIVEMVRLSASRAEERNKYKCTKDKNGKLVYKKEIPKHKGPKDTDFAIPF